MVEQPRRAPAAALAAVWLVLVACATLRPTQVVVQTPTFCIFCGPIGGVDFALNVVFFVPLGMTVRWATGRWKAALIAGAVTTLTIEVLQARLISGRDASVGDLLANTLGTLLGAWIAVALYRWLNASAAAARRYAAIFGIFVAAVLLASSWLVQPFPTRFWQLVRWTPHRANNEVFQGRLLAVELNGRFYADGVLVPPPGMYDSVSRTMKVRATLGANPPSTRRPAVIAGISNYLDEGFALSQRGSQVSFRTHLGSARLKLRVIPVGLDNAFLVSNTGVGLDDHLTIEASANSRMVVVRRLHRTGETSVTLQRTVGLAWALFMPWDVAIGPRWWPANALWLGALMLPISFFTVRSSGAPKGNPGRTIAWWPLALVLSVLAATPFTGLSALRAGEWIGVLAGVVVGAILERATAPTPVLLKAVASDGTILS